MGDIYFSRTHLPHPNPHAVIAGTFCLMSCTMQSGGALYLSKIIDNFNFLADCEALESSLRTLCRRMACHWEAMQVEKLKGLAALPQQDESAPFVVVSDVDSDVDSALAASPHIEPQSAMTPAEALSYTNQFLTSLSNARN